MESPVRFRPSLSKMHCEAKQLVSVNYSTKPPNTDPSPWLLPAALGAFCKTRSASLEKEGFATTPFQSTEVAKNPSPQRSSISNHPPFEHRNYYSSKATIHPVSTRKVSPFNCLRTTVPPHGQMPYHHRTAFVE